METKIEKLKNSQVKLNVTLSKDEFSKFIEKSLSEISKDIEIKGFRKGKVPQDIVEKMVGKEKILVEAGNMAVQESYKEAINQNNLEPISQPEVKINEIGFEEPLSFEANFTVMPEVELADYKKIASSVKKNAIEVGDKEIEGAIKWVQRSRAKFSAKLGPAETGDFVEIEYWSPDVHEIGEDHKKKDAFILGEGHFFNGFEGIISGMKPGEEKKEVELDIPKDHSFKKVAGKKIKFNIKVNSVQKVELPGLNDDFAKSLGKFETLESLKGSIKDGMKSEKEQEEAKRARNEALDKITGASKVEIPQILIERESQRMLEDLKHDIPHRLNISFEEYLKRMGKTEKEINEMIAPEAERKVKSFLVLKEIGNKENVSVSEKEIEEEVAKTLKHYADVGQAKESLQIDLGQLKDYTKEVMRTEKVFSLIDKLIK